MKKIVVGPVLSTLTSRNEQKETHFLDYRLFLGHKANMATHNLEVTKNPNPIDGFCAQVYPKSIAAGFTDSSHDNNRLKIIIFDYFFATPAGNTFLGLGFASNGLFVQPFKDL